MSEYYRKCLLELQSLIPEEEYDRIMSQEYCELDCDFLGFIDVYKQASMFIPKDKIVLDFGCYLAAQAYFFKDHKQYIGIDVSHERITKGKDLERFAPPNATHVVCSIQEYLQDIERLGDLNNFFAICSYVPDFDAVDMVVKTFPNVYKIYVGTPTVLKINGESVDSQWERRNYFSRKNANVLK